VRTEDKIHREIHRADLGGVVGESPPTQGSIPSNPIVKGSDEGIGPNYRAEKKWGRGEKTLFRQM